MSKELTTPINITISADDRIISLIEENTYKSKHSRSTENILKCLTLIAHGTPKKTSCKLTGVSIYTLQKWARLDWYHEVIDAIRTQLDEELDSALTGVAHKATEQAMDRLEHGDWVFDKAGNQVRKPISAKEAMLVAGIAFDKRSLKRGKATVISETVSTEDRLGQLAEKFREMAVVEGTHEVIPSKEVKESEIPDPEEVVIIDMDSDQEA